jgi:4-hydroxybenzoate polyprenyltransferase
MNHSQPSLNQRLRGLVRLLRPRQWVKNGFVLAPLLFTGQFTNGHAVAVTVLAMALFCIAASATYVVNDWRDAERDRAHPVKRHVRPIASGAVTPALALGLLIALYAILLAGAWALPRVLAVIAIYLVLNLAYSFGLKHQPVIDIFIVASGFVLRVIAGAQALAVPVSSWMFVTTLCLALYLAAVKRRQELAQTGSGAREVLNKYSVSLIERYAEMSATGALVFYSLFVMSTHPELIVTIPVVLFGLFRYWYIVDRKGGGESPTDVLLTDWQLLLTLLAWVVLCAVRLWG